jgi:hypothetical protein
MASASSNKGWTIAVFTGLCGVWGVHTGSIGNKELLLTMLSGFSTQLFVCDLVGRSAISDQLLGIADSNRSSSKVIMISPRPRELFFHGKRDR